MVFKLSQWLFSSFSLAQSRSPTVFERVFMCTMKSSDRVPSEAFYESSIIEII